MSRPERGRRRGNLNLARNLHTAALLDDGTVMVTGGFDGGQFGGRSDSVEIYDPKTDIWATVGGETVGHEGRR